MDKKLLEDPGAWLKDGFVNKAGFRAKMAEGRFALREMASDMRERRVWAAILGVVLLVALAGPFHTMESLGLTGRILYWGLVGVPAALMMWALNCLVGVAAPQGWPGTVVGAVAGVLGVVPMMILVAAGMWLAGAVGVATSLGYYLIAAGVALLAVIVMAALRAFAHHIVRGDEPKSD